MASTTNWDNRYFLVHETLSRLPEDFKEMRSRQGKSLRQVGRETDLSFMTISRFERRLNGPDVWTVISILWWMQEQIKKEKSS